TGPPAQPTTAGAASREPPHERVSRSPRRPAAAPRPAGVAGRARADLLRSQRIDGPATSIEAVRHWRFVAAVSRPASNAARYAKGRAQVGRARSVSRCYRHFGGTL